VRWAERNADCDTRGIACGRIVVDAEEAGAIEPILCLALTQTAWLASLIEQRCRCLLLLACLSCRVRDGLPDLFCGETRREAHAELPRRLFRLAAFFSIRSPLLLPALNQHRGRETSILHPS
jgi:hypothetical protein